MKCLIDTNVFIWWLEEPEKLSNKARELISDSKNDIIISVASLWEMAIKTRLGKLKTPGDPIEKIQEEAFEMLNIEPSHVWLVKDLPGHHQDPFDLLIISQAMYLNLPIITRDKYFDLYDIEVIW